MSRRIQWNCDYPTCENSALVEDDGFMPEGWCHSMVGDDLCPSCRDGR